MSKNLKIQVINKHVQKNHEISKNSKISQKITKNSQKSPKNPTQKNQGTTIVKPINTIQN